MASYEIRISVTAKDPSLVLRVPEETAFYRTDSDSISVARDIVYGRMAALLSNNPEVKYVYANISEVMPDGTRVYLGQFNRME